MYEVIQTINLSKDFCDFWGRVKAKAIDDLNLNVYRGEIFGLLGPNGSGKTTTVKLLLGLLFPTTGKIKILGGAPRLVKNKKYIGFLPEESYLYPYQNAEEALFFYGRLFGISRTICRKRVNDLLEMVGLQKARRRPIKEYSKGMARRIGIAQALINDPELIFLDEPTSGLDPIGTREIKDLILQLKQHGKTVFLCSHLLADVEDVCDRIAILYGGRIRSEGSVSQLLSKPSTTQFTITESSEQQLHEIMSWLHNRGVKARISEAKERLETFFLNVVEDARRQKAVTSGVEAGKTLEDFFTDTTSEAAAQKNKVIEQLLQNGKQTETIDRSEPKAKAKTSPEPQRHTILNKLVKTGPRSDDFGDDQPRQQANGKVPAADTTHPKKPILDSLLAPKDKQ